MVLDQVARTLCDQSISSYYRAITLFEFQVSILAPSQPRHVSRARALAAIKILAGLERDALANEDFEQRLAHVDYRGVLKLLLQDAGVSVLRSMLSIAELREDIETRMEQTADVARLVKFSHRFAKFGTPTAHQKGGVTMARNFLVKTKNGSDGTLKGRWREYKDTAVLQYLLHHPRHKKLRPKRVSGKSFVERLVDQANDIESIRKFFGDYISIRRVLISRGYKFEDISITGLPKVSDADFGLKPFDKSELKALKE